MCRICPRSGFGCGGARGGTLGGLRCNAAGRGSSCKLASPVPVLLIPAGLLIIGGGDASGPLAVDLPVHYPYTRARDPLSGLEVVLPYKCAGGAPRLPLPLTSERG